jgi:hypothetical protein
MSPPFRSLANSPGFTAIAPLTLAFALATSGCTIAGDYRVGEGEKTGRGYRTIAGSVHIGRGAVVDGAKTIAGNIEVEDGAATRTLHTIAGEIHIGQRATIQGDVSTIAGNIRIGTGTHIAGKVTTIAGEIELNGCRVDGPVRLTQGSLHTRDATVLPAGIIVKRARSSDEENIPRLDIGSGAEIASIEVEPNAIVELRISREARVSQITGATAVYY